MSEFDFNSVVAINEGISYTEYTKENKPTVYDEIMLQLDSTRIWMSFDIDNDPKQVKRSKLYNWLNKQEQIESWGNSVATFILKGCYSAPYHVGLISCLQHELRKAGVFIDDDIQWKETKDISIYINYRSRDKQGIGHACHFVLIQKALIRQSRGFHCKNA